MASFDLKKSAETLRFNLDKAGVSASIKAELIIVMDVSGSFEHEHEEGTTSTLIKRLVPVAMELDPDRKIDVLSFSNGADHVHHVGTVDETDCDDFVINNIIDKVPGWNGGTTYSYPLEESLKIFGWLACDDHHGHQPQGFWSRFLGRPAPVAEVHSHEKKRSIVLFVTDGENDPNNDYNDKARTIKILQESQDRGDEVYFLFIGACEHSQFEFVRKIADKFKNTGVVMASDPEAFVELPDDELMATLLVPELLEWLKAA